MKGGQSVLVGAGLALFMVLGMNRTPYGLIDDPRLSASPTQYFTNFLFNEYPLSEGGAWRHLDPTLTYVRTDTIGGVQVAHGTQTGFGTYDDSSAYLSGFSEDHVIQGTVWRSQTITSTVNKEVELLLRWSDDHPQRSTPYGPTSATGYEINVQHDGAYLQLGSFKGPELARAALPPRPATGDIFKAQISSNPDGSATIVVWWNGVEKIRYTDPNPVRGGNPGIGFYARSGAANNEFGFSSITASNLDSSLPNVPQPPRNLRIVP